MRVHRSAIRDFFTREKTADQVCNSYGVYEDKDRESFEFLKKTLIRDRKRWDNGIEVYTDKLDRVYTKYLNKRGYLELPIV